MSCFGCGKRAACSPVLSKDNPSLSYKNGKNDAILADQLYISEVNELLDTLIQQQLCMAEDALEVLCDFITKGNHSSMCSLNEAFHLLQHQETFYCLLKYFVNHRICDVLVYYALQYIKDILKFENLSSLLQQEVEKSKDHLSTSLIDFVNEQRNLFLVCNPDTFIGTAI